MTTNIFTESVLMLKDIEIKIYDSSSFYNRCWYFEVKFRKFSYKSEIMPYVEFEAKMNYIRDVISEATQPKATTKQ